MQNGTRDEAVNGNTLLQSSYILCEVVCYQLQKAYDNLKRNKVIPRAISKNNPKGHS